MPDEIDWVRQLGRGDPAAFRVLVDREARYLFGIAHSLAGNAADAEDLVQETFAGAIGGEFRGECSVRTWLVQILVRQAAMLRRSRQRHPAQPLPEADAETESRSGKGSAVAGTEAKIDLTTMLQVLSVEQRTVIVLRELQGMTYEEIATALRVPVGTVESRLYRAREELRRRFKGYLN